MTKLRTCKRMRQWPRFCYTEKVEQEVLKILQKYNGKSPSEEIELTLNFMAKKVKVCVATAHKAIKNLAQKGDIKVISGKKNYKTNRYILSDKLQ